MRVTIFRGAGDDYQFILHYLSNRPLGLFVGAFIISFLWCGRAGAKGGIILHATSWNWRDHSDTL